MTRRTSQVWSTRTTVDEFLPRGAMHPRHYIASGAARGKGGKLPLLWVDVQKLCNMCVCFHCHGTSSYHTTNTLQRRRATLIHRQYNWDWGTSYSRPPIDPYLTFPLLQNPSSATVYSHGPVSVSVRVCHKSVFYRNG